MDRKLCLNAGATFGADTFTLIKMIGEAGFDGFFTAYDEHVREYRALADSLGLLYQSVHAPFAHSAKLWQGGADADEGVTRLLACVRDCAESHVPVMVCHAYIGFEPSGGPTAVGIENYRRVVDAAAERGVKIAFENTEGEAYLAALMDAFRGYDNVGFCLDTGHELCYNGGKDMLALYGDRLFATHINDNLGVSSPEGKIFWTDDLHLVPFDGAKDWEDTARRIRACGFDGPLTLELVRASKPNRHENDGYAAMPLEAYLALAYERAARLRALVDQP